MYMYHTCKYARESTVVYMYTVHLRVCAIILYAFTCIIGEKRTTHNVHLISHLVDCVRSWGPLWAYTCFVFETMNGQLKKLFHGTRDMSKQVISLYATI